MTFKEFKARLEETTAVPTINPEQPIEANQKALITYNAIKAYAQPYKQQLGQIGSVVKTAWNNINKDEKYLSATSTQTLTRLAKKYADTAASAAIERKAAKATPEAQKAEEQPKVDSQTAVQPTQNKQPATADQQVAVGVLSKDEANLADLEIDNVVKKLNEKGTFTKLLEKFSGYSGKNGKVVLTKEQPVQLSSKGKAIAIPIQISLELGEALTESTVITEAQDFINFLEKVKYNIRDEKEAFKKLVDIVSAAIVKKFGGKDGFQVTTDKKTYFVVQTSVDPKLTKIDENSREATIYLQLRHLKNIDQKKAGNILQRTANAIKSTLKPSKLSYGNW